MGQGGALCGCARETKMLRMSESTGQTDADMRWMEEALALAADAAAVGEIPVGALVVYRAGGPEARVVGRGFNRREAECDPSAHAEIVAMREAGRTLGQWRLLECTLYVTLEPCPMCAGAIVNARLPRLVYAAADAKAGAVESLYKLCTDGRLNHRLEVRGGVCAEAAGALLRRFFQQRRKPVAEGDAIR